MRMRTRLFTSPLSNSATGGKAVSFSKGLVPLPIRSTRQGLLWVCGSTLLGGHTWTWYTYSPSGGEGSTPRIPQMGDDTAPVGCYTVYS